MTKRKTNEEYVAVGGNECPYCGGTDLYGDSFDMERSTVSQKIFCHDCEAEWADVYTLTSYVEQVPPRNESEEDEPGKTDPHSPGL